MTVQEVKMQLQEDILSILDGFGIEEAMNHQDFNNFAFQLCDAVIKNLNELDN